MEEETMRNTIDEMSKETKTHFSAQDGCLLAPKWRRPMNRTNMK